MSTSCKLNLIPADKAPAFKRLIEIMARELGSRGAAARRCGLDSGHLTHVLSGEQNLTQPTARKILAGWRKHKESRA